LLKWAGAVFDDLCQGVREIEFLADPTGGARVHGVSSESLSWKGGDEDDRDVLAIVDEPALQVKA
jgi:hypothetical protein